MFAVDAFAAAGADVVATVGCDSAGRINDGVGATAPQALARQVVTQRADVGFAFDGDGDRVVVVHGTGAIVPGDTVLGAMALVLRATHAQFAGPLVVTEQSNSGLDASLAEQGLGVVRSVVGDRAVAEAMEQHGSTFGGEESGHIIWRPALPTGDGVGAALMIARWLRAGPDAWQQACDSIRLFPAAACVVRATTRPELSGVRPFWDEVQAVRHEQAGRGVVHVRYSGTEPLLRLRVEAPSATQAQAALQRLVTAWNASNVP